MKLYYSPGACSLSPHIALIEAGLAHDLVKVNTKTKHFDGGGDFLAVNAKGYVPVLELDNGERLTEGPAIVQYIADQVPGKGLAPAAGTMARYRLQEWLNFVTSEIHKTYSPLFNPAVPEEYKTIAKARLNDRYRWIDAQLEGKSYLMGDAFSVADAYLFTVLNWKIATPVDLERWPAIASYYQRLQRRPSVARALAEEQALYAEELKRHQAA